MKQPDRLRYFLIDRDHQKDFANVLPECLITGGNICAIGVCDEEDHILGAIAYLCEHFHYYVEWLFVDPAVRRQGIGTKLLRRLFSIIGGTGERYPVTCQVPFTEEDPDLYYFLLTQQCADLGYSHDRYYLKGEDVRTSDELHRKFNLVLEQKLFFDLSKPEQEKILRQMEQEELFSVMDMKDWSEGYIPSLCRVIIVNNNLMDLILVKELPSGVLELSLLYSKYRRGLEELLLTDVKEMEQNYPDRELIFDAITEESRKIAGHLFPRARVSHIYEGEW